MARFDEDMKSWEGSSITTICDTFENLDGKGHGVKFEALSMIVCCSKPPRLDSISDINVHI